MSTPSFIKYLTDLSIVILSTENKLEMLKNELRQLNLKLPATVYIPFFAGNNKHKNRTYSQLYCFEYSSQRSKSFCDKN